MDKVLLNAKTGMNTWEDVYVPTADSAEKLEKTVTGQDVTVADISSITSDEKTAVKAAITAVGWRNVSVNGSAILAADASNNIWIIKQSDNSIAKLALA